MSFTAPASVDEPPLKRPRIRVRDHSSFWLENPGSTITLQVNRRVGAAEGLWNRLRFTGQSEAECERLYDEYCVANAERSKGRAEARRRHGFRSAGDE